MPNRPYLGRMVDDAIAMFKPHVSGTEGAVSANNPYAAEAGLEILKAGGNAFDAACAISLVLGVVEPYHSGIGGGCFHVFYDKKTDAFHAMDARGVAPKNAYQDMFLDKNGDVDLKLTEFSGRSVAVPALYRAMDNLLNQYGTMTWEQVSAPAIRLAREGFYCGFAYARISNTPEAEHNKAEYEGFSELYQNNGQPRQFGELVKNPDLADTMEAVAKNGADWFYEGPVADEIVRQVNKYQGLLVKEDLTGCAPKERPVVRGTYRGCDIISMSPPSSGGSHIIQMLNILENFDLRGMGFHSADSTHVIAETMKLMFADRSVAMGDPDFVQVNIEKITSKEYAKELAAKVNAGEALTWDDLSKANWAVLKNSSSAGYIYPTLWLQDHYEKKITDLPNVITLAGYGDAFAQAAAEAVDIIVCYADGRNDYEAAWTLPTGQSDETGKAGMGRTDSIWNELNVIGVTPGIYNDTVSITKANADVYNPEFIAAMQQALINVINTPEGQEIFSVYSHTGYAVATDADYDGARAALKVAQ